jgi:hypothetical protein
MVVMMPTFIVMAVLVRGVVPLLGMGLVMVVVAVVFQNLRIDV